jgi:hypothetical protein
MVPLAENRSSRAAASASEVIGRLFAFEQSYSIKRFVFFCRLNRVAHAETKPLAGGPSAGIVRCRPVGTPGLAEGPSPRVGGSCSVERRNGVEPGGGAASRWGRTGTLLLRLELGIARVVRRIRRWAGAYGAGTCVTEI